MTVLATRLLGVCFVTCHYLRDPVHICIFTKCVAIKVERCDRNAVRVERVQYQSSLNPNCHLWHSMYVAIHRPRLRWGGSLPQRHSPLRSYTHH